jgi:hypothetical protein
MSNEYILVNIESGRSKLNGGNFWRLTFHGLDDGLTYEMTVDPAYNNFKRSGWNHVVSDEYPFGVYAGLKRTRKKTNRGVPIVSADGRARIIYRCADDRELAELVQANIQSFQKPSTTFQELFQ